MKSIQELERDLLTDCKLRTELLTCDIVRVTHIHIVHIGQIAVIFDSINGMKVVMDRRNQIL